MLIAARLRLFFLLVFALLLSRCSPKPEATRTVSPSFYFWKTVYNLDPAFQQRVQQQTDRLYVRFFDVNWNAEKKQALPVSDITFKQQPLFKEIVPVVFITNETMQQLTAAGADSLADRVCQRIGAIAATLKNSSWSEIQLDCDWSESTRDRYFALLKRAGAQLHAQHKTLSATIRLHQVKYYQRTGVPPVDRGMLMFYNMGDLSQASTRNSIYDPMTAGQYLVNFEVYPLPLDVALPWFSWTVVQRKGKIAGLLNGMSAQRFAALTGVERSDSIHARVTEQQSVDGHLLYAGDELRFEKAGLAECRAAAAQIAPYLRGKNLRVVIFDLDPNQYNHETEKNLEAVFNELR